MADGGKQGGYFENTTPVQVLAHFKRLSAEQQNGEMRKQIELFNALSIDDRMELLFNLVMSANTAPQHVHAMIHPEEAEIGDFDAAVKAQQQS